MKPESKVHYISAVNNKQKKKLVVIYARVSSNSVDQLKSLSAQVSSLTQFASKNFEKGWSLVDTYLDVHTSKTGSTRTQLSRLIDDARVGLIDIVVVSNVSRLGRDTLQVLETIKILSACDVRIIFKDDNLDTAKDDHTLIIQLTEAIAQAENESRSEAIKWGHKRRAEHGLSKLYNHPTLGYINGTDGNLYIDEKKAETVREIFKLFLSGMSFIGIVNELEQLQIKSPTGKDKWNKRTIDTMLSNEKYTGRVILLKNDDSTPSYQYEEHHEPIISEAMLAAVQTEKQKRSNVENG